MQRRRAVTALAALAALPLAGCGDTARFAVDAGTGPRPELPPPNPTPLPTV